jgi:hypothetical protein
MIPGSREVVGALEEAEAMDDDEVDGRAFAGGVSEGRGSIWATIVNEGGSAWAGGEWLEAVSMGCFWWEV